MGDHVFSLECDALVVSAGPRTLGVLKELFPASQIDLQANSVASDWIVLNSSQKVTDSSIAVFFLDDIVRHKLEFAGRNDNTIWLCGKKVTDVPLCPIGKHAEDDDAVIRQLCDYAGRFVKTTDQVEGGIELVSRGRSFGPSRATEMPIISELPVDKLKPGLSAKAQSGVFLCWGHGSWGIILGMGGGNLMAQLVRHEEPEIDLTKFRL